MRLWRICKRKHAATAFSGIGTRDNGSRWVPVGFNAVYVAEHISLAVCELLVHMDPDDFANLFVTIEVNIPEEVQLEELDIGSLPDDWRARDEDSDLQAIGQDWIARGESVGLLVPSAIVPRETNVILNPNHPDLQKIEISDPEDFVFDPRLA